MRRRKKNPSTWLYVVGGTILAFEAYRYFVVYRRMYGGSTGPHILPPPGFENPVTPTPPPSFLASGLWNPIDGLGGGGL